ncbi:hybrid sensor histidine kinase/response regulator transcription factor [Bacteroides sp. 519]|uniref:hybrid sensor histidine kinase/response regulator transcription factor n=1 Tax=Bacteroides sp. 519 TaxID=2302937 RepID=UPI0013D08B9C|nr:hybrid sensor histidine kinase/response regulator transcription factor [Bacteroides sp. 519]NDV58493.1 hybrid sensor histidine kinase/response regulator [Bacteroides sp. 519]
MKHLTSLLLFLIYTIYSLAGSVQPSFRFRHYTVEDGLSANSIRSLLQDKRGYIWIGTENGLNCFDGVLVKDYSKSEQGHPANNSINTLCEADDGTIWIGTDVGAFWYTPHEDSFQAFDMKATNGTILLSIVYAVMQDMDKNIWFATYGQGIFRYSKTNNELIQYKIQDCFNNTYCVYADSENSIWATGNSPGKTAVYKLNKNTQEFERFTLKYPRGGRFSNALTIFEDSSHNLWLGTRETGVQRVDRYSGEVTVFLSPASGSGIMHIHSVMEYAHQVLLIGSDDGLCMLNTFNGEYTHYMPEETNPSSLSNQFIYPILKDKEGGLWIGTYYGGVNYVSPRNGQFESFVHTQYANSVGGTIISCFAEDKTGNIWIGSDDGGISRFSPQTGKFTNYMPQEGRNSLSYHNIHALCFDGDNLWIGTYSGGLNVYNTKTGTYRLYTSSDDVHSIDQNSIYAIFKDRNDNIWVTSMIGVNLYNREEDTFSRVKELGCVTMDIKQDTKGDLWFATQGKGVYRLNTTSRSWKNYQHSNKEGALAGNMVNCLHVDSYGDLWIGTTNGLCKYHPATDSFEKILLAGEVQSVNCIIEDDHNFWITTAKGLIHYVPGEGSTVFSQTDGLQSDLFLPSAGLKSADGKIYLGTVNGFNAFYPHRIRRNEFIPPVVLTGLEIFNKDIPVVSGTVLPAPLNELKQLDLSYRDNVFSIRYAALSYAIPEKNRYAFMLEGFDKEWNYVGTQYKATYTNLPAGTYTFKVKASNNDNVWNEEGTQLKIVIHPPFYLSTGFKAMYVFLIIMGIIAIFRFIIHRTEKKHQKEIEELNRSKEKEMHEAKIGFFTMIAHEIRTPVSLIIGPLEKIMSSVRNIPEEIRSDLSVIDRNSQRLLSLVNQLLDFRKVEREGISLKLGRHSIHDIIKSVSDRFTPWVTQRGARFIVDLPETDIEVIVDREAITKLISNLLTNASKYTKDEVILSCRCLQEEKLFVIVVKDNGCGITAADKQKIFHPFYQGSDTKPGTGIGLSIVNNIVQAHNGTIEVDSEVGKGSAFIVTLPIEQELNEYNSTESSILQEKLPEDILSDIPLNEDDKKDKPGMLIVDDNIEMLNFLSESFCDEYNIITAEDGEEAWGKLQNANVALIVSDWMMPVMNGVELCSKVRSNQATSHIPFILLTAKSDISSKIEAMDFGADAYIEKPFSLQYLRSCIRNLIDLREMLYQKFSKMPLVPLNSIAGNKSDEKFLIRMNEIIEENFSNPDLSVDYLADRLCISRSGLFAKIKTLANVTPNELIQLVRLKKAALLLSENKYRINEISYMVGFNNPSYFSKCFLKQFGVKPNEFLKKTNNLANEDI